MTPAPWIADDVVSGAAATPGAPSGAEDQAAVVSAAPVEGSTGGVPDDPLSVELSVVLGRLVRVLRREAPDPVGPGSLAAMATLRRCGPLRLGDLAAREGVAPPTLTRMIAALEDAGHVARQQDPGDRRAVRVSLTDGGVRLVADALAARAEVIRSRLDAMPADARTALEAALPALRTLAED